MKKITKAVIPAAGLGTRMLPIARTVPKEMLPIVDRPSMEYLIREAVESGITDILIINGRNKGIMEDYFDYSVEYDNNLRMKNKTAELADIEEVCSLANIYFIRQKVTRGLGHAISCARSFVGDEPFAVLYGDDIMAYDKPVTKQLIDAYEKYGKATAGVCEVSDEDVKRYCSLKTESLEGNIYSVSDMVEKPQTLEEKFSNFAILGRVVLTPDIFDILDNTAPGAGGEIQLTDAMKQLARTVGMTAVEYEGKRYDMGDKLGFLQANIEFALKHPVLGEKFKSYLKDFSSKL